MDWKRILGELTVSRLSKLAANAGMVGTSRMRKAQMVSALYSELDDALKHEALLLLTGVELGELVRELGVTLVSTRKQQLITVVLAHDEEEQELELSEHDFMLPDRLRLDLPQGHNVETDVEVLPCRPGGANETLFFEVQELLRRSTLSRAVIVAPRADASLLARLLSDGLDDLIESAARWRPATRDDRPLISVVLDGDAHGLADSDAGKTLVSLATRLRGRVEIRLAPKGHRLHAKVLAFQERRAHGTFFTAIVGAAQLPLAERTGDSIDANVRLAGPLESLGNAASLVKEWITHLVRDARSLTPRQLAELPTLSSVLCKVDYKQDLDTAHEIKLKHLAELLCRRGRFSTPMFDPIALEEPPKHQQRALARASEPWRRGSLLLDENGLGKTVEAGMILSRELRRRRVFASSDSAERRRALIVAPTSLHSHWREELTGKFGLEVEVVNMTAQPGDDMSSWQGSSSQIVVCGPEVAYANWEDLAGDFEILLVDEAHLYDDEVLGALMSIRIAAEQCIVASGTPAQHDISDVLSLASLAMPDNAWGSFASMAGSDEVLGRELRRAATRSYRRDVKLPKREMVDKFYDLEDDEAAAYLELRAMRFDYLKRGNHEKASAFTALEQTLLSSPQAFHATACRLIGDGPRDDADLLPRVVGDRSFAFFRKSSYFRRRLRVVRELLAHRSRPGSLMSAKEAALLEILSHHRQQPVVVFTRYRATQQRIVSMLERAKLSQLIEQLDGESSLRERQRMLARFRAKAAEARKLDGPSGVLICTDQSVEELGFQRTASALVNYDLPWNPQDVERRIARLQRWGQHETVSVFNIGARNPRAEGWTMDNRVLYASRNLFEMDLRGSDALFEVEPDVLAARLSGDDAGELSLIEEPDADVVQQLDRLLVEEPDEALDATVERAQEGDRLYRQRLRDFWSQVAHGQTMLDGARGYLFSRLQLALMQGMVGVVCAGGRTVEECSGYEVAVGVRLLFESAEHAFGVEPLDDHWLIEDEMTYLWAVGPDGELDDWADTLMAYGLVEVPKESAATIAGQDVLDYLIKEKRLLETRDLDAVPLAAWRKDAPESIGKRLAVAEEQAEALAKEAMLELRGEWQRAKNARIEQLTSRLAFAADAGTSDSVVSDIRSALDGAKSGQVSLRRHILGTQLFLILS